MRNKLSRNILHGLPALAAALLMAACASLGRPDGGPRDILPPRFVGSTPGYEELNVTGNRIQLRFDENIQVKDATNKVVVSPAQKNMPVVTGNGHVVTVELRDTLRDSTTYTIDFTDAISDLNEGNALDGFSFAFSTGPYVDTLCISGMVLEARTLEPAQGIVVGAYTNLSDTAISTLPMERVTKTNQLGQFSLRNLAPGTYRLYALNDLNRDYRWDRSEDVAFLDELVVPSVEEMTVQDTLKASDGSDSLVMRPGVRLLPDDLLLTWFNEGYKAQYLSDYQRIDRNRIKLTMGAPSDTFPLLEIIDQGPSYGKLLSSMSVLESTVSRDTLTYWITDTMLSKADTITVSARYLRTNAADSLDWSNDTLKFVMRRPRAKDMPPADNNKRQPENGGRNDSVPQPTQQFVRMQQLGGGKMSPASRLRLTTSEPIADFDPAAIRLLLAVNDSVRQPVEDFTLYCPDSLSPLTWSADVAWLPGGKYTLEVDSAAMHGIYGDPVDKQKIEITIVPDEEYSTLNFNLTGLPDDKPAVIELLDKSDKPVASSIVPAGSGRGVLRYIDPGVYYARLYVDNNGNGKWDTGVLDSIQPEETYYYPNRINLKKNWELEQTWDVNARTADMQKHNDIKKNKPQRKRGEKTEQTGDDEDDDDMFGSPFDNPFGTSAGGSRGNTNNAFGTGRGGMRNTAGGRL